MKEEGYLISFMCVVLTLWAAAFTGNMYIFMGSYLSGAGLIASIAFDNDKFIIMGLLVSACVASVVPDMSAFFADYFAGAATCAGYIYLSED